MVFVGGHGHLCEGGDLIGVGAEVGSGGGNFGFGGGKFKAVFAQAFEKGSDVGGVVGRGGIEDDDVVEVCGDPLQAFDDLVDDLDEPAGGGAAALRHYKPSEEPVGGAERLQWDGVLVDRDLVKEETRSKREKIRPLPKESRTSSTRGIGSCQGS